MSLYVRRLIGYIFLSMFLALLFGPYDGNPFNHPYHSQNSNDRQLSKDRNALKSLVDESMALDGTEKLNIKDILQKPEVRFPRYSLALIFLLSGIIFIRKSYVKKPGIPIKPRWGGFASDLICIMFLTISAYCVISYGLNYFTDADPYLYDQVAMGIGAIAYIPAVFLCTYFASNICSQYIDAGKDGVRIYYPEGGQFASWKDINGFDLKETFIVEGNSNLPNSRKMQTKLVIHTSNGDIGLFEPALKKTKSELINLLRNKAPNILQYEIDKLDDNW